MAAETSTMKDMQNGRIIQNKVIHWIKCLFLKYLKNVRFINLVGKTKEILRFHYTESI